MGTLGEKNRGGDQHRQTTSGGDRQGQLNAHAPFVHIVNTVHNSTPTSTSTSQEHSRHSLYRPITSSQEPKNTNNPSRTSENSSHPNPSQHSSNNWNHPNPTSQTNCQTTETFKLLYSNADCLTNKKAELATLIQMHKPAVIGVVEVKPKNSRYELQECEMAIDGYDIFHTLEEEGRGVCPYAKQDLRPTLVILDNSFKESVFIKCQLEREENAIFGLLYRSPNSTDEDNKQLNTTLQTAAEIPTNHLIIMGDFNYPDIDWENERSTAGDERAACIFYKATKDAFLPHTAPDGANKVPERPTTKTR